MALRYFMCAAFLLACVFVGGPAQAKIKLPAIIGDNMVLQVGEPLYFWGLADPGEYVTVIIGEEKFGVVADKKGRWMARTTPFKNGPNEITIHGKADIVLKNILWGDVWLCAGQSNMLLSVDQTAHVPTDLPETEFPEIRLFQEEPAAAKKAEFAGTGKWVVLDPQTVHNFSSIGYFFGREIYDKTQQPVGIIQAARSGATLSSWISREALDKSEFKGIAPGHDEEFEAIEKLKADLAKVDQESEPQKYKRMKYKLDYILAHAHSATSTYNSMISPLVPFSMKGMVWYQGENDLGEPLKYERMLSLLVHEYRDEFIRPYLPFIFVQVPNILKRAKEPEESYYADLREVQEDFRKKMPASYMAVAIDSVAGAEAPLHPKDKRVIAHRLASIALVTQYKQADKYNSPVYESMELQDGKIKLHFRYAGNGLTVKGAEPKGFSIAADDRLFEFAKAKVVGADVIVWSDKVKKPVAVRYAWADNPIANLYGPNNLPVTPFRTDVWPRKKKTAPADMPKEDLNGKMPLPQEELPTEKSSDEKAPEEKPPVKE
jgi:sialate O-acetylesterase